MKSLDFKHNNIKDLLECKKDLRRMFWANIENCKCQNRNAQKWQNKNVHFCTFLKAK